MQYNNDVFRIWVDHCTLEICMNFVYEKNNILKVPLGAYSRCPHGCFAYEVQMDN